MVTRYLGILLLFSSLIAAASAEAAVKIKAVYSDASNTFEILDETSMWWEDFCDPPYQEYWKQKYGIDEEDKKLFARYKELRKRYYDYTDQKGVETLKNRNGFLPIWAY